MEQGSFRTYREEAAALGSKFDNMRRQVNVVDELPRLSFVGRQGELGPLLVATWRQLSGFEHGRTWALLSGSEHTVTAHLPGGADMHVVVKDEAFVSAAKATYFLLLGLSTFTPPSPGAGQLLEGRLDRLRRRLRHCLVRDRRREA